MRKVKANILLFTLKTSFSSYSMLNDSLYREYLLGYNDFFFRIATLYIFRISEQNICVTLINMEINYMYDH